MYGDRGEAEAALAVTDLTAEATPSRFMLGTYEAERGGSVGLSIRGPLGMEGLLSPPFSHLLYSLSSCLRREYGSRSSTDGR